MIVRAGKQMMAMLLLLMMMMISAAASAAEPYRVLAVLAPGQAQPGAPFTYAIQLQLKDGVRLEDVARHLTLDAEFRDGERRLTPSGVKYALPTGARTGLVQFVFSVPSTFPAARLTFDGRLIYREGQRIEARDLPPRSLETVAQPRVARRD